MSWFNKFNHKPNILENHRKTIGNGSWLLLMMVINDGYWLVVWNISLCFPDIGNKNPNWLSYFSEGLKPPTRYMLAHVQFPYSDIQNRRKKQYPNWEAHFRTYKGRKNRTRIKLFFCGHLVGNTSKKLHPKVSVSNRQKYFLFFKFFRPLTNHPIDMWLKHNHQLTPI
jgi:hypothetical protein